MRLIVLDENFDTIGSIPLFRALLWLRRYNQPGCFELYVSKDFFNMLDSGRYLYRNDANELGVIGEVNYSQDENGDREAYAKGYFAEILLHDRVIEKTVTLTGNIETVMRGLVARKAISPEDGERAVKHLRLGSVSGLPEVLEIQVTGDNLGEKLYDIGNAHEVSHRIRYDYLTNDLVFEVWQGKDRRDTQEVNSWAVFSNSFYNIRNVTYNRNTSSYKNFAYVAGDGEGTGRVVITVDLRQPGEERKELYVDARDLQQEDGDGNRIPDEVYRAQLVQRGKEKLSEFRKVETVSIGIDPNANLVYKTDFDLGDYCTYINTEIGIATDQRITEVMETYEGGAMELSVTFGTDETSTIKQLIKREV